MVKKKFTIRRCLDCPFYNEDVEIEMNGWVQRSANCKMGYMKGHDTRDWTFRNEVWEGCKLKETEVSFEVLEGGHYEKDNLDE